MTDRFKRVPMAELQSSPRDGIVQIYGDRFWLVDDGNLLFFGGRSPQCNPDRAIVETLLLVMREKMPNLRIEFLERVYVPIRIDGEFDVRLPDSRDG